MKNNIREFKITLAQINEKVKYLAELYYEDYLKSQKVENAYIEKTFFTRTMLRRLILIAREVILPELFFIGNATAFRYMQSMTTEQQREALDKPVKLISSDGSEWSKKFEDLSPRQMNQVYDLRAKIFRSKQGQKEWIESNPVIRYSLEGSLNTVKDDPKPTKSSLIKALKQMGINEKDLAKLANASMLMSAAQIAIKTAQ